MSNSPLLLHNWFFVVLSVLLLLYYWLQNVVQNPIQLLLETPSKTNSLEPEILWSHSAVKNLSLLKNMTELRLNCITAQLDKWILNRNLHRKKWYNYTNLFQKWWEFENVQLISRKGLLSDLWSFDYQGHCCPYSIN